MDSDSDLDDILDSVLDDFEDTATDTESEVSAVLAGEAELMSRPDPTPAHMEESLDAFMKEFSGSSFGQELQKLMENAPESITGDNNTAVPSADELKMMEEMMKSLQMGMENPQGVFGAVQPPKEQPKTFQEGLDAAMKMISEGSHPISESGGQDEDAFFDRLLEEFKEMNPDDEGSMDQMMEKLMAEMLSKESLLPPLRQVVEIYPKWIEENQDSDQLKNCTEQFECFVEMKRLLEMGEDGAPVSQSVIQLMGKVQEFGNPPQEVLAMLMPGVEFDGEGNPNLPDFGLDGNGAQGMPQFPFPQSGKDGECSIM